MSENLIPTYPVETVIDETSNYDSETLAKTVRVMDYLHASEVFSTPEKSKEFLGTLDYNEFKDWLGAVNGIERGIPRDERGKVGDSFVQSKNAILGTEVEYRPPHTEFRDGLLKKAFEKAQSIDDPELAGLTLSLSINAIHYFEDGNGRVARFAYSLLSRGYDGSEVDKKFYSSILENTEGRKIVNPNPSESNIDKIVRSEMFRDVKEKSGYQEIFGDKIPTYIFEAFPDTFAGEYSSSKLAIADEIDEEGRHMLFNTVQSGGMEMTSLMMTFDPNIIKPFVKTSADGKRTFVMGNEFLPTLTKEEIKHWWENSEMLTASYVERIINVADREDVSGIVNFYKNNPNTEHQ